MSALCGNGQGLIVTLTLGGAACGLLCRLFLHVVVFLFVRADVHTFFLNAEFSTAVVNLSPILYHIYFLL